MVHLKGLTGVPESPQQISTVAVFIVRLFKSGKISLLLSTTKESLNGFPLVFVDVVEHRFDNDRWHPVDVQPDVVVALDERERDSKPLVEQQAAIGVALLVQLEQDLVKHGADGT